MSTLIDNARDRVLAYREAHPDASAPAIRKALGLKIGVRQIQRWAADAGMPLTRGRPAIEGERVTEQLWVTPSARRKIEAERDAMGVAHVSQAIEDICDRRAVARRARAARKKR